LSAAFPAQILSYNKMLGQLHNAGNATTLAGSLQLLCTACLNTFRHGPCWIEDRSPDLSPRAVSGR
jgi:hypothetical protein